MPVLLTMTYLLRKEVGMSRRRTYITDTSSKYSGRLIAASDSQLFYSDDGVTFTRFLNKFSDIVTDYDEEEYLSCSISDLAVFNDVLYIGLYEGWSTSDDSNIDSSGTRIHSYWYKVPLTDNVFTNTSFTGWTTLFNHYAYGDYGRIYPNHTLDGRLILMKYWHWNGIYKRWMKYYDIVSESSYDMGSTGDDEYGSETPDYVNILGPNSLGYYCEVSRDDSTSGDVNSSTWDEIKSMSHKYGIVMSSRSSYSVIMIEDYIYFLDSSGYINKCLLEDSYRCMRNPVLKSSSAINNYSNKMSCACDDKICIGSNKKMLVYDTSLNQLGSISVSKSYVYTVRSITNDIDNVYFYTSSVDTDGTTTYTLYKGNVENFTSTQIYSGERCINQILKIT